MFNSFLSYLLLRKFMQTEPIYYLETKKENYQQ